MSKNKKITLIISIALVSIILLIGVTYALNYTQTGTNQQLILGDIYIHYNEVSGLSISDAVPGADYSNYFEFTISGKNTYDKKDIYYDFILNKGDLPNGKTEENRIPDKYLKFKLVSVDSSNQETIIFQDKTYESLESQIIYVEMIEKNTTSEVNRKYRLYMTIDNSLNIGNTSDAVFTFSEWEQAFASIKVNVTGDFEEKKILTYEDCFGTRLLENGTLEITDYYIYDENATDELYKNQLCTTDVVIPSEIDGVTVTSLGNNSFGKKMELFSLYIVSLPDTLISIDDNALKGVYNGELHLGNNITYLKGYPFYNHWVDLYFDRTCEEIQKIPQSAEDETSSYPWLDERAPNYEQGPYSVFGTDGECYSIGWGGLGGGPTE